MYVVAMHTTTLTKKQRISFFALFLEGAAMRWYYSLDAKIRDDWREMAEIFWKFCALLLFFGNSSHARLLLALLPTQQPSNLPTMLPWSLSTAQGRNLHETEDVCLEFIPRELGVSRSAPFYACKFDQDLSIFEIVLFIGMFSYRIPFRRATLHVLTSIRDRGMPSPPIKLIANCRERTKQSEVKEKRDPRDNFFGRPCLSQRAGRADMKVKMDRDILANKKLCVDPQSRRLQKEDPAFRSRAFSITWILNKDLNLGDNH
ncbi:hydroxyethylthiazole kinase [Striga asiatica]|uniref:Hydroxyethylthiazole kinase n=1 Tax=Striga asiatica TaxID=4170 RepID=A0A5A7QJU1_STRAF|nr:hydroxyethylthiazole kinase [Striga asiatica]